MKVPPEKTAALFQKYPVYPVIPVNELLYSEPGWAPSEPFVIHSIATAFFRNIPCIQQLPSTFILPE